MTGHAATERRQAGPGDAGKGHIGVGHDADAAFQRGKRLLDHSVREHHRTGILEIGAGVDGAAHDLPFRLGPAMLTGLAVDDPERFRLDFLGFHAQ